MREECETRQEWLKGKGEFNLKWQGQSQARKQNEGGRVKKKKEMKMFARVAIRGRGLSKMAAEQGNAKRSCHLRCYWAWKAFLLAALSVPCHSRRLPWRFCHLEELWCVISCLLASPSYLKSRHFFLVQVFYSLIYLCSSVIIWCCGILAEL